eukprot:521206-Rhodomonas_salina.1
METEVPEPPLSVISDMVSTPAARMTASSPAMRGHGRCQRFRMIGPWESTIIGINALLLRLETRERWHCVMLAQV